MKIEETAISSDWLNASRLKKRADAGDKEAAEELEKLENAKGYTTCPQHMRDELRRHIEGQIARHSTGSRK